MGEKLFNKIGQVNSVFGGGSWLSKPIYWLIDKIVPTETEEGKSWQQESEIVIDEQTPVKAKILLYTVLIVMIGIIIWAKFAQVDELARGEGRVVPSGQVQVIQSLDGGIVTGILVEAGDEVNVNDPLIKIDETRAVSSLKENQSQYYALLAKEARLKALALGTEFDVLDEIRKAVPHIVSQELALYNTSRAELNSATSIAKDQVTQRQRELSEMQFRNSVAKQTYASAQKELDANKPLLVSGAVSEIEVLKLEREVTRIRGDIDQTDAQMGRIRASISEAKRKITEIRQNHRSRVRTELNDVTAKVRSLSDTSVALNDRVKQSTLKSPVHGTISRVFYNTVGGVIEPGKAVMEVVPVDDSLVIETKVQIKDIAFIRPNQPAIVKLTAYDYIIYGSLDGEVISIAADSTVDEDGNAYYLVKVKTLKNSLGKGLSILPGMIAQVDIMTGKKSVLKYLLKPVLRAKNYAFTER